MQTVSWLKLWYLILFFFSSKPGISYADEQAYALRKNMVGKEGEQQKKEKEIAKKIDRFICT